MNTFTTGLPVLSDSVESEAHNQMQVIVKHANGKQFGPSIGNGFEETGGANPPPLVPGGLNTRHLRFVTGNAS